MNHLAALDLNLLVIFDAVFRLRNVSRAAGSLHLSQPAVSNGLRRLRIHFGDRLFVRSAQGMLPTPAAESLWSTVGEALARIDARLAVNQSFDPATATREFGLVMTDIGEVVFLPPLIEYCRSHAPGVTFRTDQLPAAETIEALRGGTMDLAIGFVPDLQTGVFQQRLFDTRYVCLVGKDGPSRLTRAGFFAARHVMATAAGTGHHVVESTFRKTGVPPQIGIRVPNFLSIPMIVAASDMVATVPQPLASVFGAMTGIRMLEHPLKLPTLVIRQFWHERFHEDPANRWLRKTVHALFRAKRWPDPGSAG